MDEHTTTRRSVLAGLGTATALPGHRPTRPTSSRDRATATRSRRSRSSPTSTTSATNHPTAHGTLPHFMDAVRGGDPPQLRAMADEMDAWRVGGYSWRDDDGLADYAGQAIWEGTVEELQRMLFGDALSDHTRYEPSSTSWRDRPPSSGSAPPATTPTRTPSGRR